MTSSEDAARRVVDALRRAAVHDATRHLLSLQNREWQQADSAAEKLISQLVPGQRIHQRHIARVLTSWYVRVYRAGLDVTTPPADGQVDAAAVDQVATIVATRLGRTARPDSAVTVAAVVWRRAQHDSSVAVTQLWTDLDAAATGRSHDLVPAAATGDDTKLRAAMLRQWYRRVYLNQVRAELGLLTPLRQVSDAEADAVAQAVTDRRPYRLVDSDGVPLMTAHGTITTDADRRLDAGEINVVEAPLPTEETRLQRRVAGYWEKHDPVARLDLARACFDLPPRWVAVLADKQFRQLAHVHQLAVMHEYVRRTRPNPDEPPRFVPAEQVAGPPDEAAAAMFNLTPTAPDDDRPAAVTVTQQRSLVMDAEVREALALAAAGFSRPDQHRAGTDPQTTPPRSQRQPTPTGPSRRR